MKNQQKPVEASKLEALKQQLNFEALEERLEMVQFAAAVAAEDGSKCLNWSCRPDEEIAQ